MRSDSASVGVLLWDEPRVGVSTSSVRFPDPRARAGRPEVGSAAAQVGPQKDLSGIVLRLSYKCSLWNHLKIDKDAFEKHYFFIDS